MAKEEVIVLRCRECGDVFPLDRDAERRCRSCGGTDVEPAVEPFL